MDAGETKGLIGLLFDFEFTDFVTTKLIKLLYLVGVVLVGLSSLAFLASGFSQGALGSLVALVLSPVVFLFGVAVLRIQLELVMVIFRIADNTSALVRRDGAAE